MRRRLAASTTKDPAPVGAGKIKDPAPESGRRLLDNDCVEPFDAAKDDSLAVATAKIMHPEGPMIVDDQAGPIGDRPANTVSQDDPMDDQHAHGRNSGIKTTGHKHLQHLQTPID